MAAFFFVFLFSPPPAFATLLGMAPALAGRPCLRVAAATSPSEALRAEGEAGLCFHYVSSPASRDQRRGKGIQDSKQKGVCRAVLTHFLSFPRKRESNLVADDGGFFL